MAWATISLPVPDSPRMSTVVLVAATCDICSYIWRTGPLLPMMLEKSYRSFSSCRSWVFSSTQLLLVLLDQPLDLDRLRDRRRHDAVELDAAVVVAIGFELEVDAQRADGPAVEQDRHADEAELFLRQLGALRRAAQKGRLPAHARDDDRLAALDDLADDAFAEPVADRVRRLVEAVARLDVQLPVVAAAGSPCCARCRGAWPASRARGAAPSAGSACPRAPG